jgi:UbiD family decarboxylase
MVRTPDGTWTNASVNRMMLVDRNRLACLIPLAQHLGIINAMWKERGQRTPVALDGTTTVADAHGYRFADPATGRELRLADIP